MKLFVDDIRTPPDESWTLVRTVTEAIRAIARFDFEEISLDHDISHEVSIGNHVSRPFPCGETYAAVAYYIAAKYPCSPELRLLNGQAPKVTLHTSNEVAGDEMAKVLLETANIVAEKKYMGGAKRLKDGGWKPV